MLGGIHSTGDPRGMDRPRAGVHYPRSLGEFEAWFSTDRDCLDYLQWLRWPEGFACPDCGHADVADGEDFIHEQRFGFEVGRNREGEAYLHATTEMLEWRIESVSHFPERHDFVELAFDFFLVNTDTCCSSKHFPAR